MTINFTVWYIDDLLTLNNALFVKELLNIYPQELVLNRTQIMYMFHILDINISIFQTFFYQCI